MTSRRMTPDEIRTDLVAALSEWLPTLTGYAGPTVNALAGLDTIARELGHHAAASNVSAAEHSLQRAAAAAEKAHRSSDEHEVYQSLGSALAYLIQARGLIDIR